jgi:hypothetical protein
MSTSVSILLLAALTAPLLLVVAGLLARRRGAAAAAPRRAETMRFLIAIAVVALVSAPALAQETPGGKGRHKGEQKTEQVKKKPDDKGYNAALSRIPNQKYDPWHDVRH